MRTTATKFVYILLACVLSIASLPSWAQESQTAEPVITEQPAQTKSQTNADDAPAVESKAPAVNSDADTIIEEAPETGGDATGMTFNRLTAIVGKYTGDVTTQGRRLTFNYNDVPMTLIADEQANRMRIVTPVLEADQLSPEQMLAISLSNFHLALDARYALGGKTLFSTYIHPLKELTAGQVESAIRQVSMLRITFGTTYTSGEMSFGGQGRRGQEI